jgi:hypothetical protein
MLPEQLKENRALSAYPDAGNDFDPSVPLLADYLIDVTVPCNHQPVSLFET